MRSRRAVGSLIGIGFLLMILAVGFSYYNIISRIEDSTQNTIDEMMELDRDAADEELEIQSVALTVGNSLNLTIKNTGNEFSEIEWVGVFDDTLNTQNYYRVDTSLNPVETQKEIGNASIVMDPLNDYTIQVLTKLGNMYYGEYPVPIDTGGGGSGNMTSYYYSDYTQSDLNLDTAVGTHSFFSAMKTGPDELTNTLTEAIPVTGIANTTLISESFEGTWIPTDWSDNPPVLGGIRRVTKFMTAFSPRTLMVRHKGEAGIYCHQSWIVLMQPRFTWSSGTTMRTWIQQSSL